MTSRNFVFAPGFTESWFHAEDGYEYPMCPGTAGGTFDPDKHRFRNQPFDDVRKSLKEAIQLLRTGNPNLRFPLTVSPVPLTATLSDRQVLRP